MKTRQLIAATVALALVASTSANAGYPEKPIRVIVPYVAGGAADITARVIGAHMTKVLGATLVVENKPGANGMSYRKLLKDANVQAE